MLKSIRETSAAVRVRRICKAEIIDFAEQVARGELRGVVPIDRNRALKISQNPCALPTDPLLLIALDERDECIGYIGLIPVEFNANGYRERVAFTSTGFTLPRARHLKTGCGLMTAAETAYTSIMATGNSASADAFFKRRGYAVRINRDILRLSRGQSLAELSSLAATFQEHASGLRELPWAQLSAIEQTQVLKLLSRNNSVGVIRGPEAISWMLNNPWFPPTPRPCRRERRYLFGRNVQSVIYKVFELSGKSSADRALCITSIVKAKRSRTLKILDYGATSDIMARQLFDAVYGFFLTNIRAFDFFVFPRILGEASQIVDVGSLAENIDALFFVHTRSQRLAESFEQLTCSTVDGDLGFW